MEDETQVSNTTKRGKLYTHANTGIYIGEIGKLNFCKKFLYVFSLGYNSVHPLPL